MYRDTIVSAGTASAAQSQGLGAPSKSKEPSSWYTQVARSWGAALDRQAHRTVSLARQLNEGQDGPGAAIQVAAAAQQLSFLSTAAANVNNSIGEALQTLGRKQ
jgi:TRAP-type mannitol/chloroaromatic compound transport system substrate-binding protein